LKEATEETDKVLDTLKVEKAKANKRTEEVEVIKSACIKQKEEITKEREDANIQLQAALPILERAMKAGDSIKDSDITVIKKLKVVSDIIKIVFDCVLILFQKEILPVSIEEVTINKEKLNFFKDSFDVHSKNMIADMNFVKNLRNFTAVEKDTINDETCELLEPYVNLKQYDPKLAAKAANAAEGLCIWCSAMRD